MSKIRVGVIGAGHLGKIHARLIRQHEDVELVAIAEPSPLVQRQLIEGSEYNDVAIVGDYRKIIEGIDAAIVATPTRSHFEIAEELLSRSIDLLIEKPITDCPYQAKQLRELAIENESVLSVGHVEQHNPVFRAALEVVGAAKFIQASRTSGYTYRSTDIGVVHDLMIHDIDLVNTAFPGKMTQSNACGLSVFGDKEDIAQARLQFNCGGIATLTASRCSFSPERTIQIFGTDGFATLNLAEHSLKAIRFPGWIKSRQFDFANANPEQRQLVIQHLFDKLLPIENLVPEKVNAIEQEQREWLNCIQTGANMKNTASKAVEAVRIAGQILDQIESHCWDGKNAGSQIDLDDPQVGCELPPDLIGGKVEPAQAA